MSIGHGGRYAPRAIPPGPASERGRVAEVEVWLGEPTSGDESEVASTFWWDPDDSQHPVPGMRPLPSELRAWRKDSVERLVEVADLETNVEAVRLLPEVWRPLGKLVLVKLFAFQQVLNNLLLGPVLTLILVEWWLDGVPTLINRDFGDLNIFITACFSVEVLLGMGLAWVSSRMPPWRYLANFWNLIDALSAIPFSYVFQILRVTRFGRVLRLVKFTRLLRARRARMPLGRLAHALGVALSATVAGAIAMEATEPETVSNLGDSLWWSLATISTVGYGDVYPHSDGGRLIAGLIIFVGVGVFNYLAAVITASVMSEDEEEADRHLQKRLDQLEQSLARIEAALGAREE